MSFDDSALSLANIAGRRWIRLLDKQLARLRAGAHGNRELHFDHLVVAHLVAFFNPTLNSLRTIEDAFEHSKVRARFGLPRTPRSTVSDAQRLFDPQLLQPIVDQLRQRLKTTGADRRLDALTRDLLAVDATFFDVASRITWALPHNSTSARGCVQMCVHFDAAHGVPAGFTLVDGKTHEATVFGTRIQSGCLYLLDRAYQNYQRLNDIVAADSDFVVRLRCSASFLAHEVRQLRSADRLAGVQRDWVVIPTAAQYRFDVPVRLIEIFEPGAAEPVRLLTNRLDLPAELIGVLYRHRWQIELFFRWLKCVVGLRSFRSESPGGMTLQLYVALIGTLLLALETGNRPTKYDLAQWNLAAAGLISLDEALAVAARRRTERTRAAVTQQLRRQRKKIAR